MSVQESKTELAAFNNIISSLSPFDKPTQTHILHSVANWLKLELAGPGVAPLQVQPPFRSPAGTTKLAFSQTEDITPKDFLLQKDPKTNVERVACLAYYLTRYRDMKHFRTLDLSKINTEAAQPKFANTTYSLTNALRSGLIVPGPGGLRQLGALGEQFVNALPDRDAALAILHNRRSRRLSKGRSSAPTDSSAGPTPNRKPNHNPDTNALS